VESGSWSLELTFRKLRWNVRNDSRLKREVFELDFAKTGRR
jgi:hypothetical protein